MEVMVIGGGIGGLATALSLHAAGIGVRVFESVPEIKALGVGINLLPHAVRELTELGFAVDVLIVRVPPSLETRLFGGLFDSEEALASSDPRLEPTRALLEVIGQVAEIPPVRLDRRLVRRPVHRLLPARETVLSRRRNSSRT